MDIDLAKILTESYLVVSGIFHSFIVLLVIYWAITHYFDLSFPNISQIIDSIYQSRTTRQIVRLTKIFRLGALMPIFALIAVFSISQLIGGLLQYMASFTFFFLNTTYDPSLHYMRFGSNSQIGAVLKSACAESCNVSLEPLSEMTYGQFMGEFTRIKNRVLASNPEILERTYSSIFTPWQMILVGYMACLKMLLVIGIFCLIFPSLIERRFRIACRSRIGVAKTMLVIFIALLAVRLEWEGQIEGSVMRDFNVIVASNKIDALTHLELAEIDATGHNLVDWRQRQLSFIESDIWLRYKYNQAKHMLCLPASGLTFLPQGLDPIIFRFCKIRDASRWQR